MKKQTIIYILLAFVLFTAIKAADKNEQLDNKKIKQFFQEEITGNVLEVEWCGTNEIYNDETDRVEVDQEVEDGYETRVFGLTDEGQVFRSKNYGKTWDLATSLFKNTNSTKPFHATEISVSPVDGKTIYIWGDFDTSYMSDDCGNGSWKKINHPINLFDFRFHRKNKNWILAYQTNNCSRFDDDCDQTMRKLYYSEDAGKTFNFMTKNALEASWNRMSNFYNLENPGIIIAHVDKENGHNVAYTEDFGKTYHVIQKDGDNFFQAEFFLFLTVKPKLNSKTYQMKIATMFDDFNYFVEPYDVKLPFESKDHLSFTILKSDGAQAFLSIHHETDDFQVSNIYVSDWRGFELNLALLYNVRDEGGDCDFEKISSNEGVYIANTYDSNKIEKLRQSSKKMDANNKKTQAKKNINKELSSFKKSLISFDSASNWHSIKAPTKKWNGKPYTCSGDCSLHLAGRTYGKKGQMYSSQNAPGLIVATGNVGTHLSDTYSELNTYLSNDGGHTWAEILQGPHTFEIGDHGGIILAAPALNRTNIIKYSWDEGKTWNTYKLNIQPIEVEAIVSEPSNMDQRFIIYGRQKVKGALVTTQVVTLDLSQLNTRGCKGAEHPGRSDSDYEVWLPTNFKGDQCIFGHKIKYVRRKPDAQCYNSITTDQKTSYEECPCSEEDWECDFGFHRKNNQGDCVPMNEHYSFENLNKPPSDCNWNYMVTKGYRKVPGMFCNGGVDLSAEMKECPPKVVQPRTEETTESYQNYKAQQQKIMEELMEQQLRIKEKRAFEPTPVSSDSSIGEWFMKIVYVAFIFTLLSLSFLYREKFSFIISYIGQVGQKREERQYQQLGQSSYNSSKNKSSQPVRIETDDRNYDLEEHDGHYADEEKPVLQRDQEYYYQDYE